jgi:type VI secretion system protein ImpK
MTANAPDACDAQWQALHAAARPLVALATQLRVAVLDAPEAMKQALAAAVARFEREAQAGGCDERSIAAASYLLCTWVDEVVADTPWGAGGAGLLERFHGEQDGHTQVLRLLSRLAEQPQQHRALLELFHACLSLGLAGSLRDAPDAARQLDTLRARVYLTLPRQDIALAPAWHSAAPPSVGPLRRRVVLGLLLLLALGTLGVYTASHLQLAQRVDEVSAALQRLSGAGAGPGTTPAVAGGTAPEGNAVAAPRQAPLLAPMLASLRADDRAAGRLQVRDEAHRSVVSLPADMLFDAGSTRLSSAAAPLLARLGEQLARAGGHVQVIGHTDGADPRTARLPSAWHQTYEWARAVADALGRQLPAERLAAEGAADFEPPADAAVPRRRIDIVWFP